MPDHHSHNRGHLPVNRLFGGKEPVDLDDGLPSDVQPCRDHRDDQLSAVLAEALAQTPGAPQKRGPLSFIPWKHRDLVQPPSPVNRDGSPNAYFGRTIVDELDALATNPPNDRASLIAAELHGLAAVATATDQHPLASTDDGGRVASFGGYPIGTNELAARGLAPDARSASGFVMAPPNICGVGPAGDDFAAVPRDYTPAKSAMVRIMELTALVEQARALAVQALTDIGSAHQSELAAAGDRLLAAERTITERNARIAVLEAAAQSAIEKLAGGTE